jgi:predicted DCC family thiol-disulfide oxidoreductase YuxK
MNGSSQITVLYDGDCPLCSREIRFLERPDRGRGRVHFADIAEPSFDHGAYGLDARKVMTRIHGVLPDGTVIEGLEVFRRAYAAVGLGWLIAPTRWPGLRGEGTGGWAFKGGRARTWGAEGLHGPAQGARGPSPGRAAVSP